MGYKISTFRRSVLILLFLPNTISFLRLQTCADDIPVQLSPPQALQQPLNHDSSPQALGTRIKMFIEQHLASLNALSFALTSPNPEDVERLLGKLRSDYALVLEPYSDERSRGQEEVIQEKVTYLRVQGGDEFLVDGTLSIKNEGTRYRATFSTIANCTNTRRTLKVNYVYYLVEENGSLKISGQTMKIYNSSSTQSPVQPPEHPDPLGGKTTSPPAEIETHQPQRDESTPDLSQQVLATQNAVEAHLKSMRKLLKGLQALQELAIPLKPESRDPVPFTDTLTSQLSEIKSKVSELIAAIANLESKSKQVVVPSSLITFIENHIDKTNKLTGSDPQTNADFQKDYSEIIAPYIESAESSRVDAVNDQIRYRQLLGGVEELVSDTISIVNEDPIEVSFQTIVKDTKSGENVYLWHHFFLKTQQTWEISGQKLLSIDRQAIEPTPPPKVNNTLTPEK